jgi:hypothetical protein
MECADVGIWSGRRRSQQDRLPGAPGSGMFEPKGVGIMGINAVFALDLKSAYEGEHMIFGLLSLANFTSAPGHAGDR